MCLRERDRASGTELASRLSPAAVLWYPEDLANGANHSRHGAGLGNKVDEWHWHSGYLVAQPVRTCRVCQRKRIRPCQDTDTASHRPLFLWYESCRASWGFHTMRPGAWTLQTVMTPWKQASFFHLTLVRSTPSLSLEPSLCAVSGLLRLP
ncbi:hypothetical protein BR93DRAFT_595109 [Coniochaeta sp. PMI_546]|nr:hypothetical protein BR93DRAFT_595109 [Coniochaeta sp. PMI_546]